jgi:RNA polymerase sigma factor (sigma-70 family)
VDAPSKRTPWSIPDADGQREFVDRYEQLLVWALRLTGRRQDEARDLVHDALVAFAQGERDIEIRNLNGYLYGMLRNVLRAGRRRADRRLSEPWATVEARPGGLQQPGVDALTDLEARQTLVHIARFARQRSLQSKAGSALLLRYFHGYVPREIACIMRIPSSNVDDWLKLGRREARAAADAVPPRTPTVPSSVIRPFRTAGAKWPSGADALVELRRDIFESTPGSCLSARRVRRLYGSQPSVPVETATLAHIVTCADCLDRVSDRLGFPGVSDRHPVDGLGPSARTDTRRVSRAVIAGVVILSVALALAGRTPLMAAASGLTKAASAAITRVIDSVRRLVHQVPPLPSRPLPVSYMLPAATPHRVSIDWGVSAPPTRTTITDESAIGVEVQALYLLDREGALLGRQVEFSRGTDHSVRLITLATDAADRTRLRRALLPVTAVTGFRAEVRTSDEVGSAPATPVTRSLVIRDVELTQEPTPLLEAVRQHVAEGEVLRFINRVLDGSRQALLHASLMQELVRQFDGGQLRAVNASAFATWDAMLRYHALACARETERVRTELAAVKPGDRVADDMDKAAALSDVGSAVSDLRNLAAWHDEALGAALAAGMMSADRPKVDLDALLRSLEAAERLAQRLAGS